MIELIEQIRQNLRQFAYPNEASISHGIVTPVLQALGWNTASPQQLIPEYTIERQRVDFALLGAGRKPTVFIEVKGQGLAAQADRQLFGYAFLEGVPLCVLTDGAEWSFYVPGGQGSYEDRRVYRLQLEERSAEECEQVLTRYLQRERVCSGRAYEDAQRDYRDAASRREAVAAIPQAWQHLAQEPDGTLVSLISAKAESLSGFAPHEEDIAAFLAQLTGGQENVPHNRSRAPKSPENGTVWSAAAAQSPTSSGERGPITAKLFGKTYNYETAKDALVQLLQLVTATDPSRLPQLADMARVTDRNHIARSVREIHPGRPDLARAAEFVPGWLVNVNLSNKQKMRILDATRATYGLSDDDLIIALPNA